MLLFYATYNNFSRDPFTLISSMPMKTPDSPLTNSQIKGISSNKVTKL